MKSIKKIICLILVAVCISSFTSCLKYTSNILEVTTAREESVTSNVLATTSSYTETTTLDVSQTTSESLSTEAVSTDALTTIQSEATTSVVTTAAPTTEATTAQVTTTQAAEKSPSSWTTAETLTFLANAINKTRAYTGSVSVRHTENFSFNVSNVTGGNTVKSLANKIISSVATPSDETLNFSGGKAVNSEGETIPLLLPKKGNFSLDAAGCTSVSASKSGNNTIVKCTLVSEKVDMSSVPKYNSTACGYLDVNSLDLSVVTVTDFNITYSGTTLTITVNSEGYVTNAAYHVPLSLDASGKALGITANVQADGYEDEVWTINW